MSVKTTTVYNCDYCQKQLPDDYATTNGEGKGYYVKKAHDTIQTFATTAALSSLRWL